MQTGDLQQHVRNVRDDSDAGPARGDAGLLPACLPAPGVALDQMARLARSVEAELAPRLMLVRRGMGRPQRNSAVRMDCDEADVAELVRLLIVHDFPFAHAYVDAVRQRGVTVQNLCLGLLAPAARLLGTYWEEDRASILEVTLGLCRLHQVLHRVCADVTPAQESTDTASFRALIACPPGEQHTFGAIMVGQFLRRGGWDVWNEFPGSADALLEAVQGNSFRIVGLSVGSERLIDDMPALIRGIRRASRNRDVAILLGGPLVGEVPNLAARLGADGASMDGRETLRWAQARFPNSARSLRRG
jgi:MerR family transcriptional regulator, light-induced transcriptional regulator